MSAKPLHALVPAINQHAQSITRSVSSLASTTEEAKPCSTCDCILGEQHNSHMDAAGSLAQSFALMSTDTDTASLSSLCQDEACPNKSSRRSSHRYDITPEDGLDPDSRRSVPTSRKVSVPKAIALDSEALCRSSSTCGACPFCPDTCGRDNCEDCAQKIHALEQQRKKRQAKGCKKQLYTMCQVARHNTPESCWLVANNIVYDVTDFLSMSHPGGTRVILRKGGTDVSADYRFHSAKTRSKLWKAFAIGVLVKCPGTTDVKPQGWYQKLFSW